eukprot:4755817-Amphidinium_carterae.1
MGSIDDMVTIYEARSHLRHVLIVPWQARPGKERAATHCDSGTAKQPTFTFLSSATLVPDASKTQGACDSKQKVTARTPNKLY